MKNRIMKMFVTLALSVAMLCATSQAADILRVSGVPSVAAAGGQLGWTNGIMPQTSGTAFNGQTNRTVLDLRSLTYGDLSLEFKGTVTASTATTNIVIKLSVGDSGPLTNALGTYTGPPTNAFPLCSWTIPTAATANPQMVTSCTNLSLPYSAINVKAFPFLYIDAVLLGYCDGYLTNWTITSFGR